MGSTPVLALLTHASELKRVTADQQSRARGHLSVEIHVKRFIDVQHPAARITPEVVVPVGASIIPGHASWPFKCAQLTGLDQQTQIAVDRTEADAGYAAAHVRIDVVRCRMTGRVPHRGEYCLTLS